MESANTSLLPYVLDLLSREPDLCTSMDDMCERMQDLIVDDVIYPFGCIKRAVQFAVNLGTNLGILTVNNKRVKVPFEFRSKCNKMQVDCVEEVKKRSIKPKRDRPTPVQHFARSLLEDIPLKRSKPRTPVARSKCAAKRPKTNRVRAAATKKKLQSERVRQYAKKRKSR